MIALDIMLVALAQSAVATTAPEAPPVARPDVEVIGPSQSNRVICRTIAMSNSRIPGRRVCRTQAQIEETRDRSQREAEFSMRISDRRTLEMLETSSYGNWGRAHN